MLPPMSDPIPKTEPAAESKQASPPEKRAKYRQDVCVCVVTYFFEYTRT